MRSLLLGVLLLLGALPFAWAQEPAEDQAESADLTSQEVVDNAVKALQDFQNDPEMGAARQLLRGARGVLIVPRFYSGGFILGISGGHGVMLARTDEGWSYPAFYTATSASVGFQAGIKRSEVLMILLTEASVDGLLSTSLDLGGDVSIAAGPIGGGAGANVTSDVVVYARAKGAFAGAAIQGGLIKPDEEFNAEYYNQPASPADILVRQRVNNAGADALRQAVARATR